MPNALVHIGVQTLATRGILRNADEKWIYVGAIIPDVGWVVQRILEPVIPTIASQDLRLYAIAQTSLICSVVLATGLCLFSRRAPRTLVILLLNIGLHYLLDASETKWGNGILIFAPFDWRLLNWGWFWPEDWLIVIGTLSAGAYVLFNAKRTFATMLDIRWPKPGTLVVSVVLLATFFTLPWIMRTGALDADNHFVRTLIETEDRTGRYIEFDRVRFKPTKDGGRLFSPLVTEALRTENLPLTEEAVVSIRGYFASRDLVKVTAYHDHRGFGRDIPSVLALAYVALVFGFGLFRLRQTIRE